MLFEPIKLDTPQKNVDYNKIHIEATTDLSNPPSRPPIAISIGEYYYGQNRYPLPFGTFGNISMIKGQEKSRKSFLKSLILACAIGGRANDYSEEIRGHDLNDKYIIDIDTEQGAYDVYLNAKRIPEMVGANVENYISVQLRKYSQQEISGYLEWLFLESEYRNKIGIACIDGYVDCIKDFNSLTESEEFARTLMRYSAVCKCHITGILHLNPNSEKARGHLGTILQQKCETVVIVKDEGDYSQVLCERKRGGKKFDPFTIRVNDKWLPYVSEDENIEKTIKPNF